MRQQCSLPTQHSQGCSSASCENSACHVVVEPVNHPGKPGRLQAVLACKYSAVQEMQYRSAVACPCSTALVHAQCALTTAARRRQSRGLPESESRWRAEGLESLRTTGSPPTGLTGCSAALQPYSVPPLVAPPARLAGTTAAASHMHLLAPAWPQPAQPFPEKCASPCWCITTISGLLAKRVRGVSFKSHAARRDLGKRCACHLPLPVHLQCHFQVSHQRCCAPSARC